MSLGMQGRGTATSNPITRSSKAAEILDYDKAIDFVKAHGLLQEGEEILAEDIGEWLIKQSTMPSTDLTATMYKSSAKAFGIILKSLAQSWTVKEIIQGVSKSIKNSINETIESLESIADIRNTASATKKLIEENRKEDCSHRNEIHSNNMEASYANAVRRTTAPIALLARSSLKARQLIVDKAPNENIESLKELNEQELVERASLALELMDCHEEGEETRKATGAMKLRNGGVILEFDSASTVRHIQANRESFMDNFHSSAIIKDKTLTVLLEAVPTSHSPGDNNELRSIELNARIPKGELTGTRWIKPTEKRRSGQTQAHLIMKIISPETANIIIKEGIIIKGKRVRARKLNKEPRRCLKCQKLNSRHLAASCPEEENICATCGKNHKTSECEEDMQNKFYCVNCDCHGHASWDRSCPTFQRYLEQMESDDQDHNYKYFPTTEQWTWENTSGNAKEREAIINRPLPRFEMTRHLHSNSQTRQNEPNPTPRQVKISDIINASQRTTTQQNSVQ